jgi:hypothetical protein
LNTAHDGIHGKPESLRKLSEKLSCDMAGENEEPLKKLCLACRIIIEKTEPNTAQLNGVLERLIIYYNSGPKN